MTFTVILNEREGSLFMRFFGVYTHQNNGFASRKTFCVIASDSEAIQKTNVQNKFINPHADNMLREIGHFSQNRRFLKKQSNKFGMTLCLSLNNVWRKYI